MKTLIPVFVLLLLAGRLFAMEPAAVRLGAYRAGIAQESVQTDAGKTKDALAALIAEARLNGIGEENAAALDAFLAQLGVLAEEDMRKVIDSLKTASATAGDDSRQSRILAASENQQAIANRLFALANNIAANHAKQSLPHDLRDLIGRQLANIRLTLRLQAPGVQPEPADLARVAANQKTIAERIGAVIETMTQLVATLPPEEAEPIKVALDSFTAAKLTAVAAQAAGAAADKDLPAAGRLQARVRDILLSGTQVMTDKQTLADKLVGLSETLERLIAVQIELNTGTLEPTPDAPALADRQTGLADETGILRTTTPGLAKETAATLELARLAMQAAAAALAQGETGDVTRAKQTEALAALRTARGQVLTRLKTEMERLEQAAKALADAQAQVKAAQDNLAKSDTAAAGQSLADAAQSAETAKAQGGLPAAADAAVNAARADLADAANAAGAGPGENTAAAQNSADAAAGHLADAANSVAQAKAALANQAAAASAAADDQASAAAAAAAAAANAAYAAMQDAAADAETQATAAGAAADAADTAADAATRDDAKAAFKKAASSFREAAAAAKAGKPQLAIDAAATGNKIVSDNMHAMMIARSSSNLAGPSGTADAGLNSGFSSNPAAPAAQVLGTLKPRDREAIEQARNARTPPEFTPLIRQYFKNLADEPNR